MNLFQMWKYLLNHCLATSPKNRHEHLLEKQSRLRLFPA